MHKLNGVARTRENHVWDWRFCENGQLPNYIFRSKCESKYPLFWFENKQWRLEKIEFMNLWFNWFSNSGECCQGDPNVSELWMLCGFLCECMIECKQWNQPIDVLTLAGLQPPVCHQLPQFQQKLVRSRLIRSHYYDNCCFNSKL